MCAERWERGGGSHFCDTQNRRLGPPVVPFYPSLGEGSPTKKKTAEEKQNLILSSLLEDLGHLSVNQLVIGKA